MEARDRARGELRKVPSRTVGQGAPRVLRPAGRPASRERRADHRAGSHDMSPTDGETMRAWQVQHAGEPIDVLHCVEVPVPDPGPGQIRVRVSAAGIGLPDVLMCRGSYPLTPASPFTPGQEASGVITAVGEGVTREIGSRVMLVSAFYEGHGSFAEECLALSSSTVPVPTGLSDAEAAGFWIPHLTAWTGLVERGHLAPGEWVAVLGAAGGSGIAAVQL